MMTFRQAQPSLLLLVLATASCSFLTKYSTFTVAAFVSCVPPTSPQQHTPKTTILSSDHSNSHLYAIIYGPDGKIVREEEEEEDNSSKTDDLPRHVLYGIQAEVDAATLARVAVANAPPPHHDSLSLEDVRQAILVGVTAQSVDIALSLVSAASSASPPEEASNQQQLLQVLVTVPLAAPSQSADDVQEMERHILQQIRQLDDKAAKELEQQEETSVVDTAVAIADNLAEEPTMDVRYAVDWWTTVPPLKTFLRDEAASFQKLLNTGNEFQRDLQTLARRQLSGSDDTILQLRRVQVASIGTSGIWLKAAAIENDDDDVDESTITILDVPIPFLDGKEVVTADDLRESVLTLVESVEGMPVKAAAVIVEEEEAEPVKQALEVKIDDKDEAPSVPGKKALPEEREPEPEPISSLSKEERIIEARPQPKSSKEEAELAAKYAAIEDIGERAYTILVDLGMI